MLKYASTALEWTQAMLHGYVPEATYRVSDTYRIRIRVRYALDTYPRSIRFFIIFANVGYAVRYVSGLPIRPSHEQSGGRATRRGAEGDESCAGKVARVLASAAEPLSIRAPPPPIGAPPPPDRLRGRRFDLRRR